MSGDDSMRALIRVIENRSYHKRLRERALFWLAQSDSDDAFAYLDRLLGSLRKEAISNEMASGCYTASLQGRYPDHRNHDQCS